ncbi:amino acid adenylation domain-containing protein, partial [Spongiactinospora sp. TRM90649]|uniref:amino acid adenylation domain-containing protein n=1 Tax=Spongiactinospora sp. TRM90649 TaxID=3031114 RepID=UPI0023F6CA6B
YMVPALVVIDRLPITVNGKLDRAALPAPAVQAGTSRAPATPREELLCAIFAEVLGLPEVGADDDFFELGGHSILATRVIARVRARLNTTLTLRDVFEVSTPALLADRLGPQDAERPPLRAVQRPERIPASPAQRRLWLIERLAQNGVAYNLPMVFRVRGELDTEALRAALGDVVARHETLRTVLVEEHGELLQRIVDAPTARVPFRVGGCAEADLAARVTEAARPPFDLATGPLLRAEALRLGPDDHAVVLVLHHVVTDEWSDRPFLTDLTTAYTARAAGRAPGWAPLPVQYADYTLWQARLLGDPAASADSLSARQTAYWRRALAGLPDEIPLPFDAPRPGERGGVGGVIRAEVPAEVARELRALAAERGVSMFMLVQAGTAALLHRMGGGGDIPLGVPVTGRADAALDDLVGFFVNTLVLRTDVSGDPAFTDLLDRVRETDLAAFDHQDLPFEQVVEALHPVRAAGRNPLFQVALSYRHQDGEPSGVLGLPVEWLPTADEAAQFDLDFMYVEDDDALTLLLGFARDVMSEASAARLAERMIGVLAQVAARPETPVGRLRVLLDDERRAALSTWNDSGPPVETRTVPELFADVARARPDHVALVTERSRLTFAELSARVNGVAGLLRPYGSPGETVVGLALPRDAMVPAILGTLAAGMTYLPIDPNLPAERQARMLADAAAACVLTTPEIAGRLPAGVPPVMVDAPVTAVPSGPVRVPPAAAAYVIYTSGSTGVPKGVVGTHGGLSNLFASQRRDVIDPAAARADGPLRVVHQVSFSFDGSWEQLLWLLAGHELHVVDDQTRADPARLLCYLREERIDYLDTTPSLLLELTGQGFLDPGTHVPQVLSVGGEATPPALWERLRALPGTLVHDLYGPTECAVEAYGWHHDQRGTWAGPLADTRVHVLDSSLQPVPAGVPGEVYLAGAGLARGYLNRPGASAARFVADPYGGPGERMYRTGDLGRRDADGTLRLLGRADDQVQLRGLRIEPGEIESALIAHPGVAQAAVLVREDVPGNRRLVAYVRSSGEAAPASAELRDFLARALPEYMVPGVYVAVDALPLTANGKLDRAALPAPAVQAGTSRAPATPREELLCAIFAEVLGLPGVGTDDDFFELGGHSLLAVRAVNRVQTALGHPVPLRALFDAPTPARLATHLDEAAQTPLPALGGRPRPASVPVSPAQRRLWFLHRLDGGTIYNVPLHTRLHGALDTHALRLAFGDLIERHEPLRTLFREMDGEPFQHLLTPDEARALLVIDRNPEGHRFDLANELPIRVSLVQEGPATWLLVIELHHIAADGWSMRPLAHDLSAAYQSR